MACVKPNCPGCESCQFPRTWGKVFKETFDVYTGHRAPECGDGTLYIRRHDPMEDHMSALLRKATLSLGRRCALDVCPRLVCGPDGCLGRARHDELTRGMEGACRSRVWEIEVCLLSFRTSASSRSPSWALRSRRGAKVGSLSASAWFPRSFDGLDSSDFVPPLYPSTTTPFLSSPLVSSSSQVATRTLLRSVPRPRRSPSPRMPRPPQPPAFHPAASRPAEPSASGGRSTLTKRPNHPPRPAVLSAKPPSGSSGRLGLLAVMDDDLQGPSKRRFASSDVRPSPAAVPSHTPNSSAAFHQEVLDRGYGGSRGQGGQRGGGGGRRGGGGRGGSAGHDRPNTNAGPSTYRPQYTNDYYPTANAQGFPGGGFAGMPFDATPGPSHSYQFSGPSQPPPPPFPPQAAFRPSGAPKAKKVDPFADCEPYSHETYPPGATDRPVVLLLNDSGLIDEAVAHLKSPVGFDIEYAPSFRKGEGQKPTALLQLSDGQTILIIQTLSFLRKCPPGLKTFLEDSSILKVGVGINPDGTKLDSDLDVSCDGLVDLNTLRAPEAGQQKGGKSLAYLTGVYTQRRLLKSSNVTCSNWGTSYLRPNQLAYAANDVQSSFHIVSALAVEARTTKFAGPPGWDWSLLEDQLAQPRKRLSDDLVRRVRSARPAPDYFATNGIPPGFEVIKPPPKVEKVRMSEWWDDATLQFRQGKMLEQIAEDIRVRFKIPNPRKSVRFAILKCLSLRGERPSQAELAVLLDGLQEGSPEWDRLTRVLPAQPSGRT